MDTIAKYVINELCGFVLADKLDKFIWSLKDGDFKDQQLLACMGIELKNKIVCKTKLGEIIDSVSINKASLDFSPSSLFENVLASSQNLHFYSDEIHNCGHRIQVARIMTFDSFLQYIYNSNFDDVLISPPEKSKFLKNLVNTEELKDINLSIKGPPFRELVWVVRLDDLKILLENGTSATEIANRTGLTFKPSENSEILVLEYGSDFDEPLYQPTIVNNNWGTHSLFLSYLKNDQYGRTRPVNGIDNDGFRMKEKVYKPTNKPFHYSVAYLDGQLNNLPEIQKEIFIEDALERYRL